MMRVVEARPNPRVRPTRSSPLARHSLTHRPSCGYGRGAITLFVLGASLACESFHGKTYWAGGAPAFFASSDCSRASEGGWSNVRVEVRDDTGSALPGVTVRFARADTNETSDRLTDARGHAEARLSPGAWGVDALLPSFLPAHSSVEVLENYDCAIEFVLRLDPNPGPTVSQMQEPPDLRVQRTRSTLSARSSPQTPRPSGGWKDS